MVVKTRTDVLEKHRVLSIRNNEAPVSQTRWVTLNPGEALMLDSTIFSGYQTGTGKASLTLGPLARFDVAGLLNALNHYPYGCTEQITSRAMPLLHFDSVIEQMRLKHDRLFLVGQRMIMHWLEGVSHV